MGGGSTKILSGNFFNFWGGDFDNRKGVAEGGVGEGMCAAG